MNIELKPHFYVSGVKARGDREIWIDGAKWGHVKMKGHGCNGPDYEFYDARGKGIPAKSANGKLSTYSLVSVCMPRKWDRAADPRTIEDRIVDQTKELIAEGRLRDPKILDQEAKKAAARWATVRKAERERQDTMRDALLSLWGRADLSNSEREGLSSAYKDIFHSPIEKASLDADALTQQEGKT